MDRAEQDRDFLVQGAVWQDSLLQAYRSLHLTFQSILLAIGIGLAILPMSAPTFPRLTIQEATATILLLALWSLHIFAGRKMKHIVRARGEDVDYWHKAVILAEQALPPHQRRFTRFKIDQQDRREDRFEPSPGHLQEVFLAEQPDAETRMERLIEKLLIEKGMGHTRRVVDSQLFAAISILWAALVFVSVGFSIVGLATRA